MYFLTDVLNHELHIYTKGTRAVKNKRKVVIAEQ